MEKPDPPKTLLLGKLASEWCKEASVLVLIFGFLDGLQMEGKLPMPWWAWSMLLLGVSTAAFMAAYWLAKKGGEE